MKATFFPEAKEKFTTSHRKENVKTYFNNYKAIAVREDGTHFTAVDVRMYYTGSTMYCCFWYSDARNIWGNGSGKAAGYGYHKGSAAFSEAIRNSKFTLDQSISGIGETAIYGAIQAICEALNIGKVIIINSHA